jgi:predicted ATPase/DNA-binding SARP family transcriptional activator
VQVGILGPLEVRADGDAVAIGGARLRTVLARLTLDAGRTVPAGTLADAVWPAGTDTRHALHSLITRLRRALPAAGVVRSVADGYRLDVAPDAVDAVRFERLARAGRDALHAGQADVACRHLRAALALWRGDALADVPDAPFAAVAAARLDELRLTAQEDRAHAALLAGADPAGPVAELYALIAAHPGRERAHALLMRALHADGRAAVALDHFERVRADLADRLGVDPSSELRAAHVAVLRADRSRPPPRRGNLRAPLTSFVGRQRERELTVDRLAGARLVTLTGPGGVGKTRLACAVAAELAGGLPGGAWLVELAAVTDPDDVAATVLDALGDGGPRAISRATLLVLDNAEHLLDPVAALAEELLGRYPSVRVLVTAREPLGIQGESIVPVPPLPVAPPTATAEELRESPAVRLFADRAVAANPGFAVTAANVAEVADICRRLDGLPLAIELAAARARSVPLDHLATVVDDRFTMLTGGSRTALPRHRTLAAVVAWSWDLLSDEERRLAEALSVFPGTITPSAAERVGPSGVPVRATLACLADKSLLQPVGGPDLRYRMLETIREYGTARLAEGAAAARAAHARHFLDIAEAAAPDLRGPAQLGRLPALHAERDNLLGALRFAVGTGDADTAVRLASALSFPLTLYGDHAGAARLLRTALELPGTASAEVRAAAVAGYLLNTLISGVDPGDLDRFRAAARSAHPSAYSIEPLIAALSGAPADDLLPAGPPSHTTPWGRAMFWLLRALLRDHNGDLGETVLDLEAAAREFRAVGERWGLATSLTRLGIARAQLGDMAGGHDALSRAVVPAGELGNDDHQRIGLAVVREYAGDPTAARAELHRVLAGSPPAHHTAMARLRLGDLDRRAGNLSGAACEYERADRAAALGGELDQHLRAQRLASRALLAVAREDPGAARRELAAGFAGTPSATVAVALAAAIAAEGDPAAAARVLGAAHRLRGAADASNPDVVRVTGALRALGDGLTERYESGRSLPRAAASALLHAELSAAGRR